MRLKIKPLSVNGAWQGRRFKTDEYKAYEEMLAYLLPKLSVPSGKLHLTLKVGYSNKASDIDNCVKPFVDILQKKYGFNDKHIYRLEIEKEDVLKGSEFIEFIFKEFTTLSN